jgi:isopentenyl-diphosphate delta-isomerase
MKQKEFVILVDENDTELGLMEKHEAHQKALLHRAFSVFVFNRKGELLLQQRALNKYHSGGLWTNTCCSHPRENEKTIDAANRRLKEEMGIDCALTEKFHFMYKAHFDNGLTEHELDFIYIGTTNEEPNINSDEVASYKWINMQELITDMKLNQKNYTVWFNIILKEYLEHL